MTPFLKGLCSGHIHWLPGWQEFRMRESAGAK
jgi:hypothetical protein